MDDELGDEDRKRGNALEGEHQGKRHWPRPTMGPVRPVGNGRVSCPASINRDEAFAFVGFFLAPLKPRV